MMKMKNAFEQDLTKHFVVTANIKHRLNVFQTNIYQTLFEQVPRGNLRN